MRSWRVGFKCLVWLVAAFNFKSIFNFLGNEFAVLSDIFSPGNSTFKVLFCVKYTVNESIDGGNGTNNAPISTILSSLY